jgi:hypothetical protein
MVTARKRRIFGTAALCLAGLLAIAFPALPAAAAAAPAAPPVSAPPTASPAAPPVSASPALLRLPAFDGLSAKARESVVVTLDSSLLSLAAGFLDPSSPDDAAAREIIRGLTGIYVRSFKFDADFAYPRGDVEGLRKQLSMPAWQHIVEVRNAHEQENVDVYISIDQGRANGLAVIAAEPREFTIVNIAGAIDLQKLRRLAGKFGIPKLPVDQAPAQKSP